MNNQRRGMWPIAGLALGLVLASFGAAPLAAQVALDHDYFEDPIKDPDDRDRDPREFRSTYHRRRFQDIDPFTNDARLDRENPRTTRRVDDRGAPRRDGTDSGGSTTGMIEDDPFLPENHRRPSRDLADDSDWDLRDNRLRPRDRGDDDRRAPRIDAPISRDGGASVSPEWLRMVRDDTLGLTKDDREPYFRVLQLTTQVDSRDLQDFAIEFRRSRYDEWLNDPANTARTSRNFSQFVDLFRNPEAYRGQPVMITGTLRKLIKHPPGSNQFGIEQVYEGWVYPVDGQGNPVVVVFLDNFDNLPISGDLTEPVQFTGYFLKQYGFRAQDATRRAPLFLAKELRWTAPLNRRSDASPWIYLSMLLAALLLIGVWWHLSQRSYSSMPLSDRLIAGADHDPVVTLSQTEPVEGFDPATLAAPLVVDPALAEQMSSRSATEESRSAARVEFDHGLWNPAWWCGGALFGLLLQAALPGVNSAWFPILGVGCLVVAVVQLMTRYEVLKNSSMFSDDERMIRSAPLSMQTIGLMVTIGIFVLRYAATMIGGGSSTPPPIE